MKRNLLAALAAFLLAPASHADSWRCQLAGDMAGVRLGFFFGGQVIRGEGELSCEAGSGRAALVPVRLAILGDRAVFDFTAVRQVRIVSQVVPVRAPSELLGTYLVAAGATMIGEGEAESSAIRLEGAGKSPGFEAGLTGHQAAGLGARVHGLTFLVERR